jgi:multiple sugar transport system permease protein
MQGAHIITSPAPPRRSVGLLGRLVGAETKGGTHKALMGYLFIAPWLLGLLIFIAGPMLASFWLSLTQYDILSPPKFIGIDNYRRALFEDRLFWPSLGRTAYYSFVSVPLLLFGSLFLAMLLNRKLKGTNFYRTFFFLPHLTPDVAMAILWVWLLHPKLGPVNNLIMGPLGFPEFPWLTDKATVIPALILIVFWAGVGGNRMLIFLAGLQGVPDSLYEAADLDGASAWAKFRHVTLPMISPTMLFNLIMGIIYALQVFSVAFVATEGGPSYGSWFFAVHIYNQAFAYFRLGYGAALAWLFLVILLALTALNFVLSKRWVFYYGDSE